MSPKLAINASLPKAEKHIKSQASRRDSGPVHRNSVLFKSNASRARAVWGALPKDALESLKKLSEMHFLDVGAGELQFLDDRWYVTNAGLLQIARRNRCAGIRTAIEKGLSDPATGRWVFRATVYKFPCSRPFVGFGDANPSNVSPLVRGAEMRVAETRAVNRALRRAYGIGLCSVEELGSQPSSMPPPREGKAVGRSNGNSSTNGQPRLRDKLCLLIRKYELDPQPGETLCSRFLRNRNSPRCRPRPRRGIRFDLD